MERFNFREWGPIRLVSETQKCHDWFPSVLHSLISDELLRIPLPVLPSSNEMPVCEAVVVAAHLVEAARMSGWAEADIDYLMQELLGCSR